MPSFRRPPVLPLVALVTGAALLFACRDSTAPGDGGPLRVDRPVNGTLTGTDSVDVYTLEVRKGDELVVDLQAVSGRFELMVTPRGQESNVLAWQTVSSSATGVGGAPEVSYALSLPDAVTYRVVVRRVGPEQPAGTTGDYRLTTWRLDRRPERVSARFELGDTVTGEAIDIPEDVDEFRFHGEKGQTITASVLVDGSGPATRGVTLRVLPDTGKALLGVVMSSLANEDLDAQGSGWIVLPATGDYRVQVSMGLEDVWTTTGHVSLFTGGYRFRVAAVDPRPEHAPQQLVPGDTVEGEALETLGDIDEFTFTGEQGQQFNAFFQSVGLAGGGGTGGMYLEVTVLGGTPLGNNGLAVLGAGPNTPLLGRSTGRFTLPAGGTYVVRVLGENRATGGARGAYRLLLAAVNPLPERAPATLSFGDSVAGESLDFPGDVDEFTFTLDRRMSVDVLLWRLGTRSTEGLYVELADGSNTGQLASIYTQPASPPVTGVASGAFELGPGTHRLRVASWSFPGGGSYVGPYSLQLLAVPGREPEHAPAAVAIGDTVRDALDALGDVDVFTFAGRRGEHLRLYAQGLADSAPLGAVVGFTVSRPGAPFPALGNVFTPMRSESLEATHSGRITVPATGEYQVTVASGQGGRHLGERGAYRFVLDSLPTAPETAPAVLAPGDSVLTEAIDFADDVDVFELRGTPGAEVVAFIRAPQASMGSGGPTSLEVFNAESRDSIVGTPSYGGDQHTRTFVLPASGRVGLQVTGGVGPNGRWGVYTLWTRRVNRAPERAPATVALGDTVDEAIEHVGDIDEFTVGGTAGQRVTVYFQTPRGTCCLEGLHLYLVDPRTGRVLGSATSNGFTAFDAISTGPVTLPDTGPYLVRVQGGPEFGYGYGDYRFLVKPIP